MSGFTQVYNITKGDEWEKTGPMIIPRKGHVCVSITTKKGEEIMAVGGLDRHGSFQIILASYFFRFNIFYKLLT